jgi:hypothetical protein
MFLANSGSARLVLPLVGMAGGGAIFLLRRAVRARRAKLEGLLDRLSRHIAATARHELRDG